MATFLSAEWFDQLRASIDGLGWQQDGRPPFLLGVTIVDATGSGERGGDGSANDSGHGAELVRYGIRFTPEGARLLDPAAFAGLQPDVELTQDASVAEAVSAGQITAQHGFMTGKISVSGDVSALLANLSTASEALRSVNG